MDAISEDLKRWFKERWVDISRKDKSGKHPPCGREKSSKKGYPKCRPSVRVSSETPETTGEMSGSEKKAAVRQKRSAEATKKRKGKKPIMTSHHNIKEEYLEEKNVPTNKKLYARVKALAKRKFKVYPSAYANAWLVKTYKARGGGYKTVKEERLYAINEALENLSEVIGNAQGPFRSSEYDPESNPIFQKTVQSYVMAPEEGDPRGPRSAFWAQTIFPRTGREGASIKFRTDFKSKTTGPRPGTKTARLLARLRTEGLVLEATSKKDMPCNKPMRSSSAGKKMMVKACEGGKEKIVHFGAKGYGHNYSAAARKSFRARHKCGQKKSKLSAQYWACKKLWAGKGGSKASCPPGRKCKY